MAVAVGVAEAVGLTEGDGSVVPVTEGVLEGEAEGELVGLSESDGAGVASPASGDADGVVGDCSVRTPERPSI